MNEETFWSTIEDAWKTAGVRPVAHGKLSESKAGQVMESLDEFLSALRAGLESLGKDDLLAFDRVLERKLYDLDRAEVQEHTDGSDDGFLYARGFITAVGQDYYEAVNADPGLALRDMECEEMCYLPVHVYEERFGAIPRSGISRESCSNRAGWPDL